MNEEMKKEIDIWLRGDWGIRDFGLHREKIDMKVEYERVNGYVNTYLAIFSDKQIEEEIFDTIFVDIDGEAELSFEKMRNFMSRAESKGIIPTRVYFSGRGYHLYFDLAKVIRGKTIYREVAREFVKRIGGKDIVDWSGVGDIRRMARVVGTINSKSGLRMIRISPYMRLNMINKLAWEGKNYDWIGGKVILDIEKKAEDERNGIEMEKRRIFEEGEYPPCIVEALNLLKSIGELNHNERLMLASFLIWNDEENKLREYLKRANDFRESITNYQIEYIKRRKLKMFRCENVSAEICPYRDKRRCIYFPSLNRFFKRVKK